MHGQQLEFSVRNSGICVSSRGHWRVRAGVHLRNTVQVPVQKCHQVGVQLHPLAVSQPLVGLEAFDTPRNEIYNLRPDTAFSGYLQRTNEFV